MKKTELFILLKSDLSRSGNNSLFYSYFFCPSFRLTSTFRIYSQLSRGGFISKAISKILWMRAIKEFGCHIHPRCVIGPALYMPHPTGIVIGEGVKIGNNATIYQHVTLGIGSRARPDNYPLVGDNCTLYTSSCVLGNTVIKSQCSISANALILDGRHLNSLRSNIND